jgi:hypothetical protein
MLEQMCEASPADLLVGGSYMVPEIHGHDWGRVILGQRDQEPVVETRGFYRNSHCRKLPAMQTHWNPLSLLM